MKTKKQIQREIERVKKLRNKTSNLMSNSVYNELTTRINALNWVVGMYG